MCDKNVAASPDFFGKCVSLLFLDAERERESEAVCVIRGHYSSAEMIAWIRLQFFGGPRAESVLDLI